MNSNLHVQVSPLILNLLNEVRAGAVDAELALKSLSGMVSSNLVSMDCAYEAWIEVTNIIRMERLEPLHNGLSSISTSSMG